MRYWAALFVVLTLLGAGQAWGEPGDPLWEQTFNYLPQYDTTSPYAVAATSSIVIVTGEAYKKTGSPQTRISRGFIRFYDAATGDFKGEGDPLTLASTPNAENWNYLGDIMVSGNIVIVKGMALSLNYNTSPPTEYLVKTVVRAYNISTRQLLWENAKDGYFVNTGQNHFATSNRAFITGTEPYTGLPCNGWVRAYQIPSATLAPLFLLE